jgi:hypothetical protein
MFMDLWEFHAECFKTRTKNGDPLPHPPPTHSPLLFSTAGRSYWQKRKPTVDDGKEKSSALELSVKGERKRGEK